VRSGEAWKNYKPFSYSTTTNQTLLRAFLFVDRGSSHHKPPTHTKRREHTSRRPPVLETALQWSSSPRTKVSKTMQPVTIVYFSQYRNQYTLRTTSRLTYAYYCTKITSRYTLCPGQVVTFLKHDRLAVESHMNTLRTLNPLKFTIFIAKFFS
jgi:hypothetical protein